MTSILCSDVGSLPMFVVVGMSEPELHSGIQLSFKPISVLAQFG